MVEWNGIFRVFGYSRILGQPRELHPKFRNEIPEMTVPFAPQPGISGIFSRMESAPRFADFLSLCSCSESSLTNLIGSGLNLLCLQVHSRPECRWTWPEVAILGADQKERGFWGREWYQGSRSNTHDAMLSKTLVRHLEMKSMIANLTL